MLCPNLLTGEVQIQKRKIFSQIPGKVVEMMNRKKTRITEEDNQKAIEGDRYLRFLSSSFLKLANLEWQGVYMTTQLFETWPVEVYNWPCQQPMIHLKEFFVPENVFLQDIDSQKLLTNKMSLQNWWKHTHLHEHVLASKAGSYKVCNLSFAS